MEDHDSAPAAHSAGDTIAATDIQRLVTEIRERVDVRSAGIASLIKQAPVMGYRATLEDAVAAFRANPDLDFLPVVDSDEHPIALITRGVDDTEEPGWSGIRTVPDESSVGDVARAALVRPPTALFHPLACVDDGGAYRGVVVVEDLVHFLAGG